MLCSNPHGDNFTSPGTVIATSRLDLPVVTGLARVERGAKDHTGMLLITDIFIVSCAL